MFGIWGFVIKLTYIWQKESLKVHKSIINFIHFYFAIERKVYIFVVKNSSDPEKGLEKYQLLLTRSIKRYRLK